MNLRLNLILLLSVCFGYGFSQELDSVSTHFENGIVVVHYDFLQGQPDVNYEMYLYSSLDNFQKPLQLTSGDVGKGIEIGPGKVIYWNAEKELGVFRGDISLKIKGEPYVPFIEFINFAEGSRVKRGRSLEIQWKAHRKRDNVLLKINRNGVPVSDPAIIDNSGSFTWIIPNDIKPSKHFNVEIVDVENPLRREISPQFRVKRRFPLGYKVSLGVLIPGGVGAALMLNDDTQSGIPGPPEAPNTP
jgi:hypothetical protein